MISAARVRQREEAKRIKALDEREAALAEREAVLAEREARVQALEASQFASHHDDADRELGAATRVLLDRLRGGGE